MHRFAKEKNEIYKSQHCGVEGKSSVTGELDGCVREGDCIGYDDGRSDGAVVEGEFDGSVTDGYFDGEGEGFAVGKKDGEVVVG